MPELPEVETMRRGILAAVGGEIIAIAECQSPRRPITIEPSVRVMHRRLVGQQISDIERLGKRVVLCVGEQRLVIEPRMTGLVIVAAPPTCEHLRLRISLRGSRLDEILFWDRRGLGVVRLLGRAAYEQLRQERLGPDALQIEPAELRQRLAGSRRAIKVALLDQHAVAGIGNLYAAEILHMAAIHPIRLCSQLSCAEWIRIHDSIRTVLLSAIRYEGSTLSDGTYRNALSQAGGYQNHHRVYDRENQPCGTCGTVPVKRIVQAQRATFFCPRCQPGRRRK